MREHLLFQDEFQHKFQDKRGWGESLTVKAVQHIGRMRGGAQSHLMLGADENLYVVKFQNNPQHTRVLANELMATRLAEAIGLPVAAGEVIEVSEWLIAHSADLDIDMGRSRVRCAPGLHFGSRFIGGLMPGNLMDYLTDEMLLEVRNVEEFAGALAFDKWTNNVNGRQAVFLKKSRERRYTATFIDHGYCFNAGEWRFADGAVRGVYNRNVVYTGVTGWESFEPWLGRIEALSVAKVWSVAETVPPEWYGGDPAALEELVQRLMTRRERIRELIDSFRECDRKPFPKWVGAEQKVPAVELAVRRWVEDRSSGQASSKLVM